MKTLEEISTIVTNLYGISPRYKSRKRKHAEAKRIFIHSLGYACGRSDMTYFSMGFSAEEIGEFLGISHVMVLRYRKSELSRLSLAVTASVVQCIHPEMSLKVKRALKAKIDEEVRKLNMEISFLADMSRKEKELISGKNVTKRKQPPFKALRVKP